MRSSATKEGKSPMMTGQLVEGEVLELSECDEGTKAALHFA